MRPQSEASSPRSQPDVSERPPIGQSQTGRSRARRSQPADEEVLHTWPGVVGPRPTILSFLSWVLIGVIFAHLLFDLPSWWPFAAGGVALVFNLALAVWQAGSVRVVAVTESGIKVMRKARWRSRCTHLVGTMPRMPLGPVSGRWSRSSIANTVMWVHRKHHPVVIDFDSQYLNTFRDWNGAQQARPGTRGSILEGLEADDGEVDQPAIDQVGVAQVTVE